MEGLAAVGIEACCWKLTPKLIATKGGGSNQRVVLHESMSEVNVRGCPEIRFAVPCPLTRPQPTRSRRESSRAASFRPSRRVPTRIACACQLGSHRRRRRQRIPPPHSAIRDPGPAASTQSLSRLGAEPPEPPADDSCLAARARVSPARRVLAADAARTERTVGGGPSAASPRTGRPRPAARQWESGPTAPELAALKLPESCQAERLRGGREAVDRGLRGVVD